MHSAGQTIHLGPYQDAIKIVLPGAGIYTSTGPGLGSKTKPLLPGERIQYPRKGPAHKTPHPARQRQP